MTSRTSVIIPCYNAASYLMEALESARTQTIPPLEIVVVDDGSTVPVELPAQWQGPPITLLRTPNRGQAAARNLAATHCHGEFIAFLDADDLWLPGKLEAQ